MHVSKSSGSHPTLKMMFYCLVRDLMWEKFYYFTINTAIVCFSVKKIIIKRDGKATPWKLVVLLTLQLSAHIYEEKIAWKFEA